MLLYPSEQVKKRSWWRPKVHPKLFPGTFIRKGISSPGGDFEITIWKDSKGKERTWNSKCFIFEQEQLEND